jgi:hypothetical protein
VNLEWFWNGFPGRRGMAMTFKVEVKPDYVSMLWEGAFESSDIEYFTTQLIETCKTRRCSKMLIDLREVQGTLSTMDRFNIGLTGSTKYFKAKLTGKILNCRFAAVGHVPLMDPSRFAETVAVNRGVNVKSFTDINEALRWLTEEREK